MKEDSFLILIGRKLSGQASEDELKELETWLQSGKNNRKTYHQISQIWDQTSFEQKNTDAPFQKVLEKLEKKSNSQPAFFRNKYKNSNLKWYYGAAVLVILAASMVFFQREFQYEEIDQTPSITMITKSNPAGQKSKVHLPDGSIVWLNAESELYYPSKFDSLNRTVELSGEAFFEVTRDDHRPFAVTAGGITTTALGTAFNINAYQENKNIEVILVSGKVKITAAQLDDLYLEPGSGMDYQKEDSTARVHLYDLALVTAWKDGVLLFKEADFSTIIARLERWYGVSIQVQGSPDKNFVYTGKFSDEYLSNVLESMSFGRPFTYMINDKNVMIKF